MSKDRAGEVCYHGLDARGQERELEIGNGDGETKSEWFWRPLCRLGKKVFYEG